MNNKIKQVFETVLPYLTVFLATLYRPIDPDLGWHLKYGEYFFKNFQILRENTFSTEMSEFIWANISWGADLVYYIFYSMGGFIGLTIGGALVVVLTFFFFAKAFNLDFWEKAIIFPVVLYLMNPVHANSFRGQQLSLLLFSVLIYLLKKYEKFQGKSLYIIPLLFLIWANTHGLFVVGLGVLGLWLGLDIFSLILKEKSIRPVIPRVKLFTFIIISSFAFTLIHPFGIRIYEDALLHFNDPLLKRVAEYLPAAELSPQWMNLLFTLIFAVIGLIVFLIKNTWKQKLPQIGVFSVLFLLSTWVRRYSWNMYYLVIPFLKPIANFIRPDSKKGAYMGATMLFILYLIIVIFLKYPFNQFTKMNWDIYCAEFAKCSPSGAEALKNYYEEGKTMTLYNWGGWLIWNYPYMKPSTDGRMHLWRDEKNFSAFELDYAYEQNVKDINKSKYDIIFTATYKPIYKRLIELSSNRLWKLVYRDDTTVIFTRVK